jgi:Zn finger protein HypA/HybF involved in hydrogenase expression
MFRQPAIKYKCPKCNTTKIIHPRDGTLENEMFFCPNCKTGMVKVDMNFLDKLKIKFFHKSI